MPEALGDGASDGGKARHCNLVHVDGDHSEQATLADLRNMHAAAVCNDNVVLADDAFDCPDFDASGATYCTDKCGAECDCFARGFCSGSSRGYWHAVREGLVEHALCFPTGWDGVYPKGFCAGRLIC